MFGLKWQEFNKKDQLVMKQKDFKTEKQRAAFIEKLKQKDNFYGIIAYSDR